jgi:hypothetical protein
MSDSFVHLIWANDVDKAKLVHTLDARKNNSCYHMAKIMLLTLVQNAVQMNATPKRYLVRLQPSLKSIYHLTLIFNVT